ncbi:MAG TPA: hypothetical protein VK762_11295 [Polyangiaceae bacterium]|nr:hypothetical protein [Polyangiaceae bacterium]
MHPHVGHRFELGSLATILVLALGVTAGCGGASSGPGFQGPGSAQSEDGDASSGAGSSGGSGGMGASSSGGTSSSGTSSGSSSGAPKPSSSSGSSGSGGSSGSSGSSSGSSGGSTAGGSGKIPTMLPTAKGTCPTLKSGGMQSIMLNGSSMSWSMSVGTKASSATGPIVIYWHGTGTNAGESATALGNGITDIVNLGGIVAAADSTSSTGTNTGDGVWYTGDVDFADFIIACAIQQLNIDASHIHVAGYSAGAIQTGYMWYARSGYVASAIVYSGGASGFGQQLQDPSNVPSLIGAHGAAGSSSCTITSSNCDFLAGSTTMFETTAKSAGAPMVIDCDDGSSHVDITRLSKLSPVAWQFFKDHPFKAGKPDAYAGGLPSAFPTYCKIQ